MQYLFRNEQDKYVYIADYFVRNKSTVRKTAEHYEIPKSTIHRMLRSDKLKRYNKSLYDKAARLLNKNKKEAFKRMIKANKQRLKKRK